MSGIKPKITSEDFAREGIEINNLSEPFVSTEFIASSRVRPDTQMIAPGEVL